MFIQKKLAIGAMAILSVAFLGCGPSAMEKKLGAEKKVVAAANQAFAEVRAAATGDKAKEHADQLRAGLREVKLSLNAISVTDTELDGIVKDKYFGDAKAQLAILRSPKTGPEQAQKARAEFFRTQQMSGRGVVGFGVSASGVDKLVAEAHHRAERANNPNAHKATPKKRGRTLAGR